MKSIYDFPDIYEAVLQRPQEVIETEVRSIRRLLADRRLTGGRILELACGTCVHGIELARAGFVVTGLDNSSAMLAAAERRGMAAGVMLDLVQGDIVDFDLNVEPFDCAIFMFETFPIITEYDDLQRHFQAVRRHLRPGGLYIIDIDARKHWDCEASGEWGRQTFPLSHGSVEVWYEDVPGDWVQGTSHLVQYARIAVDGAVFETADDWQLRIYSPWDLAVLVRTLPGWSLTGFFSWRTLSQSIGDEDHYFMVVE